MALPITPHDPYRYVKLNPPATWESGKKMWEEIRATLERKIEERKAKILAEKEEELKNALAKVAEAQKNMMPNTNIQKLERLANAVKAEVQAAKQGNIPRTLTNTYSVKLIGEIDIFNKAWDRENLTRTASAKSEAARTPPHVLYNKKVLASLSAHKARNPGTKLNKNTLKKFKERVKAEVGEINVSKVLSNVEFTRKYNASNFLGGKRKSKKSRKSSRR